MIINIKDKIIYAIYGNDDYMINVKNIIQILQKNKTKQIVINNDNMNYNNNNEKYKYLIIKINNSIFTINNYGTFGDGTIPFSHLLNAYINPFTDSIKEFQFK